MPPTYGAAIIVGLLNTILISILGIIAATIIGFAVGIMRLSGNWVVSRLAVCYIEFFRNVPLLLQVFVFYVAVLQPLPGPKTALNFLDSWFLSNRGLMMPMPVFGEGAWLALVGLIVAIALVWLVRRWAHARQMATGQPFPVFWASVAMLIGLPLIGLAIAGFPLTWDYPELAGFNFKGGLTVTPELIALWLALAIYTGSDIAESVRAGIQAVSHGQSEAAHALGLRHGTTLRLVIIPQALRVIIPPVASAYLSLTKNSSLGIAIGYPDIVATGGTVLNQSGQAIEVVLHLDGCVSIAQPAHVGLHELVQCPDETGGAIGHGHASFRALPLSAAKTRRSLPAPASETGIQGWMIKNLFSSPFHSVLTIIFGAFALWLIWGVVDWMVVRASWTGVDRTACIQENAGQCWPLVAAKFPQWIYGFFPIEERWRVNLCFVLGIIGLAPMMIPSVPHKFWNAIYLLVDLPADRTHSPVRRPFRNCAGEPMRGLALCCCWPLSPCRWPASGVQEGISRNRLALILAGPPSSSGLQRSFSILPLSISGLRRLALCRSIVGLLDIGSRASIDRCCRWREKAGRR